MKNNNKKPVSKFDSIFNVAIVLQMVFSLIPVRVIFNYGYSVFDGHHAVYYSDSLKCVIFFAPVLAIFIFIVKTFWKNKKIAKKLIWIQLLRLPVSLFQILFIESVDQYSRTNLFVLIVNMIFWFYVLILLMMNIKRVDYRLNQE